MDEPETIAEEAEDDPFADVRQAKPWLELIREAEAAFDEYQAKADSVEKLYANLKTMASPDSTKREMKMFWANMEVLKPSVYARPPVPVVTPRFKSRAPKPQAAADVLERCLLSSYDMEDIDSTLKLVRDDMTLIGRGAMWLRLEGRDQGEAVVYEHVHRCDFLHDPARKWQEVPWVAKRSWLTKEAGEERFGEAWGRVKAEERKDQSTEGAKGEKRGEVWELWHKVKGCVVWVSPKQDDSTEVLDIQPPPYDLRKFFPCPKPAYGTLEPGTLRPVPDMVYYKDQLEEINILTARIAALGQALKVKGFYAAGNGDVGSAVEAAVKSTDDRAIMVPMANVAGLGGASVKDSIAWMPIDVIAVTIKECVALRQQLITDVYQITGISDIMRGSTDADETLGAQQLKSQYGNVRIRDKQEAMINMALEVTEIAAELMAEQFSPETIKSFSQVDDIPDRAAVEQQVMAIKQQVQQAMQNPQAMQMAQQNPEQAQQLLQQAQQQVQELQEQVTFEDVIELLRGEKTRLFMLDIETNSTIQPDEMADKQSRAEALTAIGGYISQAAPMVQGEPATAPFVAETLKWMAGGFRMGRAMDTAIDEFAEVIKAKASGEKPPSPEQQAAQMEAQIKGEELKATTEIEKLKIQADLKMHEDDIAVKREEIELRSAEALHNNDGAEQERGMKREEGQRQDKSTATIAKVATQQEKILDALAMIGEAMKAAGAAQGTVQ